MLIETGVDQALFARSLTAKRHGSVALTPQNPETLGNGSERTLLFGARNMVPIVLARRSTSTSSSRTKETKPVRPDAETLSLHLVFRWLSEISSAMQCSIDSATGALWWGRPIN
jgi:hypothetical protein